MCVDYDAAPDELAGDDRRRRQMCIGDRHNLSVTRDVNTHQPHERRAITVVVRKAPSRSLSSLLLSYPVSHVGSKFLFQKRLLQD